MASNQPNTKRDVGGQKEDKPKGSPAQPTKQPGTPANQPAKS